MNTRTRNRTPWRHALTLLVLLALPVSTLGDWVSVTPDGRVTDLITAPLDPTSVSVDWSCGDGFGVTIEMTELALRSCATKGGEFVELGWPNAAQAGEIGTPSVLAIRRLFVAPPEADVSLIADAGPGFTVNSEAVGFPLVLKPVQPPIPKIPGARESAEFVLDEAAYELAEDYPAERFALEELGIVRGQRLLLLTAYPVAFNAAEQRITYYPRLAAEIRFEGGADTGHELSVMPGLDQVVLNPEMLPVGARGVGNYLIIVANAYQTTIAPFAAAKSAQGFTVTTWVPTSASATTIKNYIQGLWGGPNSPDYVLLVGDTDTIPEWEGGGVGSPDTDLPYACMDGGDDWYPDIAIGRFPVRSTSQLQAIIDKTLYYEDGPLADPDYVNRAVFMASEDNYTVSEGTHNWVIDNYMDPNDIVSDKLYSHTYDATTQQVRNAFNDGRFFGIYSGHGSTTSWADGPPFSQSDVNNLTNGDMYPFVCSFACVTGSYTLTECFTETWIRAANKGALAIYGSSVNSYWTEDDVLEKRLFDAIYDEGDDVPGEVGPVWNETRVRYLAQMGSGSTTRRYFEMYNLMGDPSLRFPGAVLDPLFISFPNGLPTALVPGEPTDISLQIVAGEEQYVSGSGLLHYRYDGGAFLTADLTHVSGNTYRATLPAAACDMTPEYYFSAAGDAGSTVLSPANAPAAVYTAVVGTATVVMDDDFESDLGWTVGDVGDDATTGIWDRDNPSSTEAQPGDDHTPGAGTICWVTDARGGSLGDYDVDGGKTTLMSPALDLSDFADATISYYRWYSNDTGSTPHTDVFTVDISNNGGGSWTNVETVGPSGDETSGGWYYHEFNVAAFVAPTSQVRLRFVAADEGDGSLVEAAVDDFHVETFACEMTNPPGDLNCDGLVNAFDIDPFVLALSDPAGYASQYPDCNRLLADIDGSGDVNSFDIDPFVELLTGS